MHSGEAKPPAFCDSDRARTHLEDDFFGSAAEGQAGVDLHATGDGLRLMSDRHFVTDLARQRRELLQASQRGSLIFGFN